MSWTDVARLPGAAALASGVLIAGALSGCAPTSATTQAAAPLTPTQQYSVKVEESPERVAFNVHPEGMSLTQRAALISMVSRWRANPTSGDFAVQEPAGARDAAARTSADIQAGLRAMGVPAERIRLGDYEAPAGAPVLISYDRLDAKAADCQGGWDNLTSTGKNGPSTHFGCAVTANFAAMVADPRDLLGPTPDAPSDADRRATVLGKYRAGAITSTPRDEQAGGTVSKVVN